MEGISIFFLIFKILVVHKLVVTDFVTNGLSVLIIVPEGKCHTRHERIGGPPPFSSKQSYQKFAIFLGYFNLSNKRAHLSFYVKRDIGFVALL